MLLVPHGFGGMPCAFFLSRVCDDSSDVLVENACVLFFLLYLNDLKALAFHVDWHFVP